MSQKDNYQKDLEHLMEETKTFAQLRPWEWLDDTDLFAFRLDGEEPVYCSVLGASGQLSGIAFYPGDLGLQGFIDVVEDRLDDVDLYFSQLSYSLELTDRDALDSQDYKLVRSSGVTFRGRGQWPSWMYLEPGYLPRQPAREKFGMLARWMKAAEQSVRWLRERPEDRTLIRTGRCIQFDIDQQGRMTEEVIALEQVLDRNGRQQETIRIHHDLQVRALREKCRRTDAVWEIDAFYQGVPVDGDPPFVPLLLLMIDPRAGAVLGSHLAHPSTQVEEFQAYLFSFFEQNREIPSQIVTTNSRLHGQLAPLLSRLGITFDEVDELFIIPHVKTQIREEIEGIIDGGQEL